MKKIYFFRCEWGALSRCKPRIYCIEWIWWMCLREIKSEAVTERAIGKRKYSVKRNCWRYATMASEKETTAAAVSSKSQPSNQANNNKSSLVINSVAVQNESGKEKKKSIRRAFSMPRNPFRLSRRVKSTNAANGNEQNAETMAAAVTSADGGNQSLNGVSVPEQQPREQDNKHRIFRRSAWKKFLSRIAQQMTSSSIGVSTVRAHGIHSDRVYESLCVKYSVLRPFNSIFFHYEFHFF